MATSKKKGHTIVDMLSLIGGFFGLFAGFSFLSAGEIVKYLVIIPSLILIKKQWPLNVKNLRLKIRNVNLWRIFKRFSNARMALKQRRLRKIDPTSVTKTRNNFGKYFTNFLDNSSIHSFNHIGNSERSLTEKYIAIITINYFNH